MNGAWQTHPSENFTKRGDVHPSFIIKNRAVIKCALNPNPVSSVCAHRFSMSKTHGTDKPMNDPRPMTVKTSASAMAYLSVTSLE